MKVKLTLRMKMNASLVENGAKVADIGCDHGYVAIWLVQEKDCPVVIATDVKEGPLSHARRNINDAGLSDRIELRLGDGLSTIEPREVDTVLIAGMGGMTICEILSSEPGVLKNVDTLILQPQSDLEEVRRHLHKVGFFIEKESICMEDGKYYFAIRAKQGEEKKPYTDTEYRFGRLLAEEGGSVYRSYMRSMTDKLESLLDTLELPGIEIGERTAARKEELKDELKKLKDSFKK